jgi:Stigma-specific protein, Stig1
MRTTTGERAGVCCLLAALAACGGPTPAVDAGEDRPTPPADVAQDTAFAPDVEAIDAAADGAADDGRVDAAAACAMGETMCSGACVDTQSDGAHCGACGVACPMGQRCAMGACACPVDQTLCSGACVDTRTSVAHCGACGATCAMGEMCVAGRCRINCPLPLMICGAGAAMSCVDMSSDVNHCGACGMACPNPANAMAACVMGSCALGACDAGSADCDRSVANGCETRTSNDVRNCGACGRVCANPANATAACAMGSCAVGVCGAGFGDCDGLAANGCEAQLSMDARNCGRCGGACAAGESCSAGVCRPPFATSNPLMPVLIPGSAGCAIALDTNADQIDVSSDGGVWVVMLCGSQVRVSRSVDGARSFSVPVVVPTTGSALAATLLARSRDEVIVLAGSTVGAVEAQRSTNGGATWRVAPAPVASGFGSTGPGPAVTITQQGTALFATFSSGDPASVVRVYRSDDAASSWAAFGAPMVAGPNYCPDLFALGATELIMANESGRQVFRSGVAAPSWTQIGVIGAGTPFTDFALGGTQLFATGGSTNVERATVTATGVTGIVSATVLNGSQARSLDADASGNLAMALQTSSTEFAIYSWPASAPALPAPVRWSPSGSTTGFPAIAAIPTVRGSVTVASGQAGVYAYVYVP